MKVLFKKSRDVRDPERGTEQAAGIDFFVPVMNEKFITDFINKNKPYYDFTDKYDELLEHRFIIVDPGMRIVIPSGIHTAFSPKDSALIAANKSGVSTKKGLVFTCQVVDSDYTGEIHIGVANVSDAPVTVKEGEKLMQFIHTPVYLSSVEAVDSEDTFNKMHENTARGDNWAGSTDKSEK